MSRRYNVWPIALGLCGSLLPVVCATSSWTQQPAAVLSSANAVVPPLVRFSGVLNDGNGKALTGTVSVTFGLYEEQEGGSPLWLETQKVSADKTGSYAVLLGSMSGTGLSADLFAAGEARWLGVQVEGQAEQPRIMLLSVPYALKAADAETLGGKPPSAYMTTPKPGMRSASGAGSEKTATKARPEAIGGSGSAGYLARWSNGSSLTDSAIYQSGGYLSIGTTAPGNPLRVVGNGKFAVVSAIQTATSDEDAIGVEGATFSTGGTGVWGVNNAASGVSHGVTGQAVSPQGAGVYGFNEAVTGAAAGVLGSSESPAGAGVSGKNTSESGGIGVLGTSSGPEGSGVAGENNNENGGYGVLGKTTSAAAVGVQGQNTATSGKGFGVIGISYGSEGYGIFGTNKSGTGSTYGVVGEAASTGGNGVFGHATAETGSTAGIYGESDSTSGVGAVGTATAKTGSAFGVKGVTASDAGVGVYGISLSATGTNYGVEGTAASPDGDGVLGSNTSKTGDSIGVHAATESTQGIALFSVAVGQSAENTGERPIAIAGSTNQPKGIGVAGAADNGWAMAAANSSDTYHTVRFQNTSADDGAPVFRAEGTVTNDYCEIDTNGNEVCTGKITTAQVLTSGGGTGGAAKVALYPVSAAENWFEDAGSGRLTNGTAVVQLDPAFAATVNSALEYHVFLTPIGDCNGLYVANKAAAGFEVRELGGGNANVGFDYRIMARRKGYENVRLEDLTDRYAKIEARAKLMNAKRPWPKMPALPGPEASQVPPPPRLPSDKPVQPANLLRTIPAGQSSPR